jgi:hypothetical protein
VGGREESLDGPVNSVLEALGNILPDIGEGRCRDGYAKRTERGSSRLVGFATATMDHPLIRDKMVLFNVKCIARTS